MVLEEELKMLSIISKILSYKREHPYSEPQQVFEQVFEHIRSEKEESLKYLMIKVATKSLDILEKNPNFTDREIIKVIINEGFPKIGQEN